MKFFFVKYEGTGNDFVVIDNTDKKFPIIKSNIINICNRKYGVGGDGLVLLQKSFKGKFLMRVFNCDGLEVDTCGNAIRCLVAFLCRRNDGCKEIFIDTLYRRYRCKWKSGVVSVDMGIPKILGCSGNVFFLDTGVPHMVVFVDKLDRFKRDIKECFINTGININYAKIKKDGSIVMRTFERGIEGETLSCGTGATSVFYCSYKYFGVRDCIDLYFYFGESLSFHISKYKKSLVGIWMSGRVSKVLMEVLNYENRNTKRAKRSRVSCWGDTFYGKSFSKIWS